MQHEWNIRGPKGQFVKGGGIAREKRFWAKVDKSGDCWVWTAATNPRGYGRFQLAGGQNKTVEAHRWSWEQANGEPVPEGLIVCHRCDNPPCVNPDHLFVGTHSANVQDARSKGRLWGQKTLHCRRGHEYTEATTRWVKRPDGNTYRTCRICQIESARKRREKRRGLSS